MIYLFPVLILLIQSVDHGTPSSSSSCTSNSSSQFVSDPPLKHKKRKVQHRKSNKTHSREPDESCPVTPRHTTFHNKDETGGQFTPKPEDGDHVGHGAAHSNATEVSGAKGVTTRSSVTTPVEVSGIMGVTTRSQVTTPVAVSGVMGVTTRSQVTTPVEADNQLLLDNSTKVTRVKQSVTTSSINCFAFTIDDGMLCNYCINYGC